MQPLEDRGEFDRYAHFDRTNTLLHRRRPCHTTAPSPHTLACSMTATVHCSSNAFANDNVGGQPLGDLQWSSARDVSLVVGGRHLICRASNVAKDMVAQHAHHHRKRHASMQPVYHEVTAPSRTVPVIEHQTPHNEEVANSRHVPTTNPHTPSPSVDAQPRLTAASDTKAVFPRAANSGTSLASPEPNVTR
jgi:hypothetical protein